MSTLNERAGKTSTVRLPLVVEVTPDPHWTYMVSARLLGASVVDARYTPGRGLHDGSILTEEIGDRVAAVVARMLAEAPR
jgi:hypothetical protein